MTEIDFVRYLEAKRALDDRSLNRHVRDTLLRHIPRAPDLLELGAGSGTMLARLLQEGVLTGGRYTALDADAANTTAFARRLAGLGFTRSAGAWQRDALSVQLVTSDLFDYLEASGARWDVLLAHAFLDLVDLDHALPLLFDHLRPGGLFYFTLNFDGITAFEPVLDRRLDAEIERLYHRSMDERIVDGRRSGDSRTGRRLLNAVRRYGGQLLAAGASDWVVYAGPDGRYPDDEAFFLHTILNFVETTLTGHPELDGDRFADWLAARRAQVETGELIYIAHQLDVAGRLPSP